MFKIDFRLLFAVIFLKFLSFPLFAQQGYTIYHMSKIPQSAYVNTSFMPENRFYVGLPVISSNYFGLENSSFKYTDVVQRRDDDSLYVNMDNLLDKLDETNYLKLNLQVDLLGFGFRSSKNYFSFSAREIIHTELIYPRNLVALFWEGNAQFIGQRVSLDGLAYNYMSYREYAFGYSRKLSDKLTVGLRAKWLNGMENIQTVESKLGITTHEDTYDLTLDGSANIRTSGVSSLIDLDFNYQDRLFRYSNSGFGLDVGANYKFSEKLSFSAAVNDIGYIHWKNDIANYVIADSSFTFSGIHLNELVGESEDSESAFDKLVDSLSDAFIPLKSEESYRTHLRSFLYLGGQYQLLPNHSLGLVLHGSFIDRNFRPAITASWVGDFTNWLNASLTYSVYGGSYSNLGAGLVVKAGPVQVYGVSDNIFSLIAPLENQNWHFRFGMNLLFGNLAANGETDNEL